MMDERETVACLLCGGRDYDVVVRQRDLSNRDSDEMFTVVRCQGCGFKYLNPRPTLSGMGRFYPPQYYSHVGRPRRISRAKRRLMEVYYDYPAEDRRGYTSALWKIILWHDYLWRRFRRKDIVPWTGRGRILDVGCGPGVNLLTFQAQGWDVHGLDASPRAVESAARLMGDDRIRLGELEALAYPSGSFDVVFFSHTLEHVHDPLTVLREAHRILDDKGLLVAMLPNASSCEAAIFGPWWWPWELPRHLYHFDRRSLGQLLARTGFRMVRCRTGVGSLFFMASFERAWTQRFGRPLPLRRLWEWFVARPFGLATGHAGLGSELTIYAEKAHLPAGAKTSPYESEKGAKV
jgi:SAM-dependent methyltransferase